MPVTTLDPITALIVVDLQKGIINSPFIHPVAGVIKRTCALLCDFVGVISQAYEQGFNVTLALDAMTDVRSEAHEYSLASVFPRLGETGLTQDILNLLATRSA